MPRALHNQFRNEFGKMVNQRYNLFVLKDNGLDHLASQVLRKAPVVYR
jgi:hypothetical protein